MIALVLLWTVAAGNNLKEEKADPISSMFNNVFGMMSEKAVNQVMEHQK